MEIVVNVAYVAGTWSLISNWVSPCIIRPSLQIVFGGDRY